MPLKVNTNTYVPVTSKVGKRKKYQFWEGRNRENILEYSNVEAGK